MSLRCLIFGHVWHNEQGWATYIKYDEPCERLACTTTRNPRPYGVITQTIEIDLRPFQRAMKRMSEQLRIFGQQMSKVTASPAGQRILAAARYQQSVEEMQAIAAIERRAALGYLDQRMDELYADLGLVRDTTDHGVAGPVEHKEK